MTKRKKRDVTSFNIPLSLSRSHSSSLIIEFITSDRNYPHFFFTQCSNTKNKLALSICPSSDIVYQLVLCGHWAIGITIFAFTFFLFVVFLCFYSSKEKKSLIN
ncbi:TIMEOUT/TIM-2 protein [Sarcoptes scabiei]|nr:TIMEOUT/TIM-2 protein [Sarcoptes scabiei]